MSDWKLEQMIKASGWPLAPELLWPSADFNARLPTPDGGVLVPLLWACGHGKDGVVKHMLAHGARVQDRTDAGLTPLDLAIACGSFQTVMLLIDQLKTQAAPAPDAALKEHLMHTFRNGHPNLKNRLAQTLRDWERVARKASAHRPSQRGIPMLKNDGGVGPTPEPPAAASPPPPTPPTH